MSLPGGADHTATARELHEARSLTLRRPAVITHCTVTPSLDRPSAAVPLPPLLIAKIGGSLLTDKTGYCVPNRAAIDAFGAEVAAHLDRLRGRFVAVLGSGSYGSGVSIRYHLRADSERWRLADLAMMTIKQLEFATEVALAWRALDIPVFPFHTCSLLLTDDTLPAASFLAPVEHALAMGLVPLMVGDIVFDRARRFIIYSSDGIPELLAERHAIERVAMLTDVAGVLIRSVDPPRLLRRLTRDNAAEALSETGASAKPDITGGMRAKVESLVRLAERGIPCVICEGQDPANLPRALFDTSPPGTWVAFS